MKCWSYKRRKIDETPKRASDDFSTFDSLWDTKKEEKPKKTKRKTTKKEKVETEEKTSKKSKDEELWDDWMKIPDWLKSEDEK